MKDAAFRSNEKLFKEVEEVKKRIRSDIRDKCSAKDGVAPSSGECFVISVTYGEFHHEKAAEKPIRRGDFVVRKPVKEESD